MISAKSIKSEKSLRELIEKNLRKEIHPGTKPSIDFIDKILKDAYDDGLSYDLSDMRSTILAFALNSTNQSSTCVKIVKGMQFIGQQEMAEEAPDEEKPIVFFDVEVYPNLFVVCWKAQGTPDIVKMINPTGAELEPLFAQKLVGFNNRRYDNHILYGRWLGYGLEDLFLLSQKLIYNEKNNNGALFGEAYNLSYTDIFDFSSKKQSLKKFQIELDIFHQELDLPWDQPVPEGLWGKVVDYCVNDVISTEAVFDDREQDFVARQILAELSGLSVNHTTQQHTARIIFGEDKNPRRHFVYTDLSEDFPGYVFDGQKSTYGEEDPGEGGYVYAEHGYYEDVAVLDVASMHPTSIVELNLFGPYTKNFKDLLDARIAIKRKEWDSARTMLDGKIAPYLEGAEQDSEKADNLAYALKIVINIVYGLTSARWDSIFRDYHNKDNIVAKRGALFMIDLRHAVQDAGFTVAHIKTDSIKIPNATPEIIQYVIDIGNNYGYHFEHETTYEKLCLTNDAVYIASSNCEWTAVGAQFQHAVVFKILFTKDVPEFKDYCETKQVRKGRMYLDMAGTGEIEDMIYVGSTGSFVPVLNGGTLYRIQDGKKYAVTGTKGYQWVERDTARHRDSLGELDIDMSYFDRLVAEAKAAIEEFVPYEEFVK